MPVVDESRIKFFEQKGRGMCGPATLRTVLAYFGVKKSEKDLASICGATVAAGSPPEGLILGLKKLSFMVEFGTAPTKEEGWKILNHWVNEMSLPVIVNWFAPQGEVWDGHYSTVYKLTKEEIWLADPEFTTLRKRKHNLSWRNFSTAWFDFRGDYIKRPNDLILRFWLVGYPRYSSQ